MILKKWTARKRLSRDTSQSTECFKSENTIRNNALASFASVCHRIASSEDAESEARIWRTSSIINSMTTRVRGARCRREE